MDVSCLTKLYYIMDGHGNFYRLSESGQLITAAGKQEAETFTFVDANRRIGGGKKAKFYHTIEASKLEEVESEIKSETIPEAEPEKPTTSVVTVFAEKKPEAPAAEIPEEPEDKEYIEEEPVFDITQIDWMAVLEQFCRIADGLNDYKTDLANRQYNLEMNLQDLLHYVELCEIDDEQSLQIMDEIRETRQHRRDVKDELSRIEFFQQSLCSSTNVCKSRNALRQMEKLATRIYHPRNIPELFENAQFQETRALPYWNYSMNANRQFAENEETDDPYRREDNEMMQERRDTIFDGIENNWLSFARTQREFYANARQHMTNLEIDIRTIDILIEEIMVRIEDANFNVAQGYKVFNSRPFQLSRSKRQRAVDQT